MWRQKQVLNTVLFKDFPIKDEILEKLEKPTKDERVDQFRRRFGLMTERKWKDWIENDLVKIMIKEPTILKNCTHPSWREVEVTFQTYADKTTKELAAKKALETPITTKPADNIATSIPEVPSKIAESAKKEGVATILQPLTAKEVVAESIPLKDVTQPLATDNINKAIETIAQNVVNNDSGNILKG